MIILEVIGAIAVLAILAAGLEWISKNVSFKNGS